MNETQNDTPTQWMMLDVAPPLEWLLEMHREWIMAESKRRVDIDY